MKNIIKAKITDFLQKKTTVTNFVIKKINNKRLIFADKLITFALDKKIRNIFLSKIIHFTHQSLIRNVYVAGHKPANNHYIPRFLLNKFKISPNLGEIYQYTFFKEPENVSIKKEAAQLPDLYTSTDKGTKNKSDFIEKQIFGLTLEKYASRIINEIIRNEEIDLTSYEQSILTTFMAFQYVRTPKFFAFVKLTIEYLNLKKRVPIEEMFEVNFYKKLFFDNFYNIDLKDLANFGVQNKKSMSGAENLILSLSMQVGNHLSSLIYGNNLQVLTAREPAYFYLSDSPSNIFNLEKGRSVGLFLWEFGVDSLVYMPISPNHCLYYEYAKEKKPTYLVGFLIEKATSESIYQFAYSDKLKDEIRQFFNDKS